MTKRALITGDRGFIGRHFRTELEARGYEVAGLDIRSRPPYDCQRYFRSEFRNIDNPYRTKWDLVVHAAAVVGGRETIEGDPLATAENLAIDADLFRWAARAKPGRVIYFSSSAAYPVDQQSGPEYGRLHENFVWGEACGGLLMPDQVYGWSKVTGELLADRLREAGVPVTVVRPFSGYGTDQDTTYPFPAFIARALAGENPFDVWCGSCVRDFIHVDDIVAGTLALADADVTDPVNLCTGEPTSFNLLATMVVRELDDYAPVVRELADKPSGVAYRVGDPGRMLEYYTPKVTLEEGIRRALAGVV